uniref:Potassium/proton antiporter CemA n=1 Tax=Chlamydomonas applanata TaxID=35704 RepID=A0A0S2LP95_CHLAP|nr:chloroplast enveloppe membrane protein [Chlamydomonas applanata]
MSSQNKNNNPSSQNKQGLKNTADNKQEVVSITYEEIGLFPRSFSRVLDRFLKQVFSDVETLVIQEYRFYRYLFLTTFKSLLILFFVPFLVNFCAKNYVVRPLTEYFWNTKQTEIFLNSYQQKRAFAELKDFEEKLYFESLIYPKSPAAPASHSGGAFVKSPEGDERIGSIAGFAQRSSETMRPETVGALSPKVAGYGGTSDSITPIVTGASRDRDPIGGVEQNRVRFGSLIENRRSRFSSGTKSPVSDRSDSKGRFDVDPSGETTQEENKDQSLFNSPFTLSTVLPPTHILERQMGDQEPSVGEKTHTRRVEENKGLNSNLVSVSDEKTESLINSYTLKSSLFVYQTREADKNIQQRYQEKTIELAQRYNDQSIEAITNFFADLISLLTLLYLLYALEIQINITKSFLLEVFFGLDDTKKSLLILLVTDLLVGYHSSNLWELFFEFLFNHYGLPESQTGIFLLVATLPVLLDVLFKYLIFRHLNRASPATVATYRAMIE